MNHDFDLFIVQSWSNPEKVRRLANPFRVQ